MLKRIGRMKWRTKIWKEDMLFIIAYGGWEDNTRNGLGDNMLHILA